ncbi:hypothetical protein M0805_001679 [Coniferiporia weirii]|nr:hypothetical protein M0805_001679 [Coniferiporia weirii]
MDSKKRKREVDPPRIAFITPSRTFERLFKETSLESLITTIIKKLRLDEDTNVELSQLRDGRHIDLEDEDDFDAMRSFALHNGAVEVKVSFSSASIATEVPKRFEPSAPRVESSSSREREKSNLSHSNATSPNLDTHGPVSTPVSLPSKKGKSRLKVQDASAAPLVSYVPSEGIAADTREESLERPKPKRKKVKKARPVDSTASNFVAPVEMPSLEAAPEKKRAGDMDTSDFLASKFMEEPPLKKVRKAVVKHAPKLSTPNVEAPIGGVSREGNSSAEVPLPLNKSKQSSSELTKPLKEKRKKGKKAFKKDTVAETSPAIVSPAVTVSPIPLPSPAIPSSLRQPSPKTTNIGMSNSALPQFSGPHLSSNQSDETNAEGSKRPPISEGKVIFPAPAPVPSPTAPVQPLANSKKRKRKLKDSEQTSNIAVVDAHLIALQGNKHDPLPSEGPIKTKRRKLAAGADRVLPCASSSAVAGETNSKPVHASDTTATIPAPTVPSGVQSSSAIEAGKSALAGETEWTQDEIDMALGDIVGDVLRRAREGTKTASRSINDVISYIPAVEKAADADVPEPIREDVQKKIKAKEKTKNGRKTTGISGAPGLPESGLTGDKVGQNVSGSSSLSAGGTSPVSPLITTREADSPKESVDQGEVDVVRKFEGAEHSQSPVDGLTESRVSQRRYGRLNSTRRQRSVRDEDPDEQTASSTLDINSPSLGAPFAPSGPNASEVIIEHKDEGSSSESGTESDNEVEENGCTVSGLPTDLPLQSMLLEGAQNSQRQRSLSLDDFNFEDFEALLKPKNIPSWRDIPSSSEDNSEHEKEALSPDEEEEEEHEKKPPRGSLILRRASSTPSADGEDDEDTPEAVGSDFFGASYSVNVSGERETLQGRKSENDGTVVRHSEEPPRCVDAVSGDGDGPPTLEVLRLGGGTEGEQESSQASCLPLLKEVSTRGESVLTQGAADSALRQAMVEDHTTFLANVGKLDSESSPVGLPVVDEEDAVDERHDASESVNTEFTSECSDRDELSQEDELMDSPEPPAAGAVSDIISKDPGITTDLYLPPSQSDEADHQTGKLVDNRLEGLPSLKNALIEPAPVQTNIVDSASGKADEVEENLAETPAVAKGPRYVTRRSVSVNPVDTSDYNVSEPSKGVALRQRKKQSLTPVPEDDKNLGIASRLRRRKQKDEVMTPPVHIRGGRQNPTQPARRKATSVNIEVDDPLKAIVDIPKSPGNLVDELSRPSIENVSRSVVDGLADIGEKSASTTEVEGSFDGEDGDASVLANTVSPVSHSAAPQDSIEQRSNTSRAGSLVASSATDSDINDEEVGTSGKRSREHAPRPPLNAYRSLNDIAGRQNLFSPAATQHSSFALSPVKPFVSEAQAEGPGKGTDESDDSSSASSDSDSNDRSGIPKEKRAGSKLSKPRKGFASILSFLGSKP